MKVTDENVIFAFKKTKVAYRKYNDIEDFRLYNLKYNKISKNNESMKKTFIEFLEKQNLIKEKNIEYILDSEKLCSKLSSAIKLPVYDIRRITHEA